MLTQILNKLEHDIFAVTFNMNDTFYWATADSSTVDVEDLKDLEPVIDKYGSDAITAYEALKRGHDPQIPQIVTSSFKAAKQEIENILTTQDQYTLFDLRSSLTMEPHTVRERRKISKMIAKSVDNIFSFFSGR